MPDVMYSFGRNFRVNATRHELWRGRDRLQLPRMPVRVLICLIERRPKYVSIRTLKEDIGITIRKESLRPYITEIRNTLSDDAKNLRFIRNDGKGGYAFIAEFQKIGEVSSEGGTDLRSVTQYDSLVSVSSRPIPVGTKWVHQITDHAGAQKTTTWTLTGKGSFEGKEAYLIVSGNTTTLWDVKTLNPMSTMRDGRVISVTILHEGALNWPLFLGAT